VPPPAARAAADIESTPCRPILRDGQPGHGAVDVSITTASVARALVVPADALLALSSGGLRGRGGNGRARASRREHRLFDDADGLVQISGAGVAPASGS